MNRLLDTNAYSAWKRGHTGAMEIVRRSDQLILSAIVAGELLFGFDQGSRQAQNLRELQEFLDRPQVHFLPVSYVTADRFARVASALRRRGTPIPTNDMWIAAHALESAADLVSFDRHFENIDGLALVNPDR